MPRKRPAFEFKGFSVLLPEALQPPSPPPARRRPSRRTSAPDRKTSPIHTRPTTSPSSRPRSRSHSRSHSRSPSSPRSNRHRVYPASPHPRRKSRPSRGSSTIRRDVPSDRADDVPSGYPGSPGADRSDRAVSPAARREVLRDSRSGRSARSRGSALDYPPGAKYSDSSEGRRGRGAGYSDRHTVYEEHGAQFIDGGGTGERDVGRASDSRSGRSGKDFGGIVDKVKDKFDGDSHNSYQESGFLGFGKGKSHGSDDEDEEGKSKITKQNVVKAALIAAVVASIGLLIKKLFFGKKEKEKKKLEDEEKKKQKYWGEGMHQQGQFEGLDDDDLLSENALKPQPPHSMFHVQVPQNEAFIVERGGRYHRKLNPGNNLLVPCVDQIAFRHSLKETSIPIPMQQCYTHDNVSVRVNGLLFIRIEDPVAASYGVENPYRSVILLTQTCIRGEIGRITLDKAFEQRYEINDRIVTIVNQAARPWGLRCTRFELRDIDPPEELRATMDREIQAERQKRADILASEAEREAIINRADGEMQAQMKLSQARQMEIVNQAIGEAHAIAERGEAIASAMRDVAEVMNEPGGEQAMQMKIAEQYIAAYGRPPPPNLLFPNQGPGGANIFDPLSFLNNMAPPPAPQVHIPAHLPGAMPAQVPGHVAAPAGYPGAPLDPHRTYPQMHVPHQAAPHPQAHPQHVAQAHAPHVPQTHLQHAKQAPGHAGVPQADMGFYPQVGSLAGNVFGAAESLYGSSRMGSLPGPPGMPMG